MNDNLVPEQRLASIENELAKLSKLIDDRLIATVNDSIEERKNQMPRLQGLLTSFRLWTAGIATGLIGFLGEMGIDMDDEQQKYARLAVAVICCVLIYSDTHRKIGA